MEDLCLAIDWHPSQSKSCSFSLRSAHSNVTSAFMKLSLVSRTIFFISCTYFAMLGIKRNTRSEQLEYGDCFQILQCTKCMTYLFSGVGAFDLSLPASFWLPTRLTWLSEPIWWPHDIEILRRGIFSPSVPLGSACGLASGRSPRGKAPLHFAAQTGHDSVVEQVLEAKAAVDVQENDNGHFLRQRFGGEASWGMGSWGRGWNGEMLICWWFNFFSGNCFYKAWMAYQDKYVLLFL